MEEKTVLFKIDGAVARLTLNRPDKLNALTREMMLELDYRLNQATTDKAVMVIALEGAGRSFCAGQDLSERDPEKVNWPLDLEHIQKELFHPVIQQIKKVPKPVVACVNGIAAGAGAAIALASDIVVASKSAGFALSFVKIGLSVDAGLGQILANSLGVARAKALLMLGETISAKEAEKAGLIWRCCEDHELADQFSDLISRLASAPKASIAGLKQAIAASHLPLDDYLLQEAEIQGQVGKHPDYAEGVSAFLQKRRPNFL